MLKPSGYDDVLYLIGRGVAVAFYVDTDSAASTRDPMVLKLLPEHHSQNISKSCAALEAVIVLIGSLLTADWLSIHC